MFTFSFEAFFKGFHTEKVLELHSHDNRSLKSMPLFYRVIHGFNVAPPQT